MKIIKAFAVSLMLLAIPAIIVIQKNISQKSLWEEAYNRKKEARKKGIKKNKEAKILQLKEYFDGIKIAYGEKESGYPANYLMDEYNKMLASRAGLKSTDNIEWVKRGPINVGGRTRALLYDPEDKTYNTWYAGSATGGVWKTVNGGQDWECISNSILYQATTTLAMPKTNPNVIYVGTGESFPGSMQTTGGGIFVSEDKGASWSHLESTAGNKDFRYVNRIIIHPEHADTILAATSIGILRSKNKGVNWEKVYSGANVEDLIADKTDFNIIYAGVNKVGVIRSFDMGDTWDTVTDGMEGGLERTELAVATKTSGLIYASMSKIDNFSVLYCSEDFGNNWQKVATETENNFDFLGGQGAYNNTIEVHPYNDKVVFWGGVNLWKAAIGDKKRIGGAEMKAFYGENTEGFLSFNEFKGNGLPGINTGKYEGSISITTDEYVNVELRFGPGKSQKAHRFTVPNQATFGVSASNYYYQDYVEVPFEVWDTDNNKQLMCSFRDQEKDGTFNLYETTGEGWGQLGREYIFVHALDYDGQDPDPNVAIDGGRSYKLIYFMWPQLSNGGKWEPKNLPESKQVIKSIKVTEQLSLISNVSDAYDDYDSENNYNQYLGLGKTSIPGFHPDHHNLLMIPVKESNGEFWILNANDGGLGISKDKGNTFTQIKRGYQTTQFYGVAKKPYRNEYIGGMQDNGTWQSPINAEAGLDEEFIFRLGGDGFEAIWHSEDSNKILGSVFNNRISFSLDNGKSWDISESGIQKDDGPFITKLTNLKTNPDKVFAVCNDGLYINDDFGGGSWYKKTMPEGWLGNGLLVSSSHNVKASLADDDIIWAGAGMNDRNGLKIFVSENQGSTFRAVNAPTFDMPYRISGMVTHPVNKKECFMLYSAFGKPKILRTTDLGNTWSDISGFNEGTESSNGFPNVGCLSLMVFPDDTNRIWAGTEIGIVESKDNGKTWGLLQSELPPVSVWQMFMQDNQVVVATYGRGIWTYQYKEAPIKPSSAKEFMGNIVEHKIDVYPNPSYGKFNIELINIPNSAQVKVSVYNLSGTKIHSSLSFIDPQSGVIEKNLSSLTEGIYVLTVETKTGLFVTKKIVIRK